ncbi:MAG: alpha-E domain-containing protein [Burkholderiaceae bacterium]|nr:alpha-E domain-containing protein [Burkholderiaceae bacterium]
MLSRTADHLFWMARYTERAENTARLLDVNVQTAMMPQSPESAERGWRAMLSICELQPHFDEKFGILTAKDVIDFMVRDPNNPSSIVSCLRGARENARAVRGTLTTEVWETHNATWLETQDRLRGSRLENDPSQFFEWVKYRSHLSRGVTIGTMLIDEALNFIRLGTFLERADNTARLLDVKFHNAKGVSQSQLQSQNQSQSGQSQSQSQAEGEADSEEQLDFYYWAAILRSVSGFEAYRKVYRNVITPARVADFLILRGDMPRSLLACMEEVIANLQKVGNDASKDTERFAGKLHAELRFHRVDDILREGLHDYLTKFLERIFELGNRISRDFLVPLTA